MKLYLACISAALTLMGTSGFFIIGLADASRAFPEAPMFQGKNLVNGRIISLEDFRNHVLIIVFWTTWCPACQR